MTLDEVKDIAIDETFNVSITPRGDLDYVTGRAAFEQELIIRLTDGMRELIGQPDVEEQTIIELAESNLERVASEMGELDSLSTYQASFRDDVEWSVLEIEVIYDTGEVLVFEVEE